MQRRILGKDGPLEVPAIGLGCMGMTPIYGTPDPAQAIATIRRAADLDAAFIDTSDAYGAGKNEELVGQAIKGMRTRIILATKFGNLGPQGANGRPEYVMQACDASLKRLGVDEIDLYYQHRVDPDVPIEETVGAMSRLIEKGKVRYLGLSEAGAQTIRRAHATHPITALQTEYSLFTRVVEDEILPACRALGIGFVAYSPLGRGYLTGTIASQNDLADNDRRRDHPRYQGENFENNVKLVAPLCEIAQRNGATLGQLALAWLLSRGADVVPIPGTSKPHRLEENLATLEKSVDASWIEETGAAVDAAKVSGTRYPAPQMKTIGI
ncbi:MAG: aldo/keto reductase [Alphaproteobacteria bacterium]|nr:aldo/keto reductase [Alphaproteobacteria bacterium]